MTTFTLKLFYLDGKDVSVILPEAEVPKFLESHKKDLPYWAEGAQDSAFYAPSSQVRYITIHKMVDPQPEVIEEPQVEAIEAEIQE